MEQKKIKPSITKKILLAIRNVESRNLDKPYANISEISKESGISRPTVHKYLPILLLKQDIFEVEGKGRGTWVQSRYAKIARLTYESMLKKEASLKQFIEQAFQKKVYTTDNNFDEYLTLGVSFLPSELDKTVLSDLESLKSIYDNYFKVVHRKVFSKKARILYFAKKYVNLVSDLEKTQQEWFDILCNKERYLESKFLPFLQYGFPVLSKILSDVRALVNTANFICDNQILDARFIFTQNVNKILNQGALELDALFDSLDVTL